MICSPCTKSCNLKRGICLGCYRTINEITSWSHSTDEEKLKINERASWRKTMSFQSMTDEEILLNSVCEFCHRTAYEVQHWNKASIDDKRRINYMANWRASLSSTCCDKCKTQKYPNNVFKYNKSNLCKICENLVKEPLNEEE
jgi:predicted Fe-S protein YdhL (DUF1289 family)